MFSDTPYFLPKQLILRTLFFGHMKISDVFRFLCFQTTTFLDQCLFNKPYFIRRPLVDA